MVKCWNCQHLIIAYAGTPTSERLFEKEVCKCPVRGVVFESRRDITKEHECEEYIEAKYKIKYEQVEAIRKQMFM